MTSVCPAVSPALTSDLPSDPQTDLCGGGRDHHQAPRLGARAVRGGHGRRRAEAECGAALPADLSAGAAAALRQAHQGADHEAAAGGGQWHLSSPTLISQTLTCRYCTDSLFRGACLCIFFCVGHLIVNTTHFTTDNPFTASIGRHTDRSAIISHTCYCLLRVTLCGIISMPV